MKEADFQAWVVACAVALGWKWWHVPAPMVAAGSEWHPAKQAAGLPDLILIHDDPPRIIFAELKGDGGRLSDAQKEFLQAARLVADASFSFGEFTGEGVIGDAVRIPRTVGAYAWKPGDEQIIEDILRSKVLLAA